MQSSFINAGSSALHYYKWGVGEKLIVAFHGYGNSGLLWQSLAQSVRLKYTFLSIELPHHGKSKDWNADQELRTADLVILVKTLMKNNHVDTCTLLGFSLGGRICLSLAEAATSLISHILLIAPDGLKFNFFYYFVTRNSIGKRLFRNFNSQPEPWLKLARFLRKRKLLSASRYEFIQAHVGTPSKREFLLSAWPSLRQIVPQFHPLQRALSKSKLPVDIIAGPFDNVIPIGVAMRFAKGLDDVILHVLDKSHRIFDKETLHLAERLLLNFSDKE